MKELQEKLNQTISLLRSTKYENGQSYHLIEPAATDNRLTCSILQAMGLENEPSIKLYLYIDDEFAYKSKAYPKDHNPVINLDIDM